MVLIRENQSVTLAWKGIKPGVHKNKNAEKLREPLTCKLGQPVLSHSELLLQGQGKNKFEIRLFPG